MTTGIRKFVQIEVVDQVLEKHRVKERPEVVNDLKQLPVRQPKPPPPEGGISIRAASRKYGMPNPTLSIWVKKGYIPILLRTKNELYVDEAKLAEVIACYKSAPGQGKNTVKSVFGK